MQIVINTDDALSDVDREILGLVLGGDAPTKPAARATGTRAAAKTTKPEPEEDLLGGDAPAEEVTMDDVVARATEIINAKKQADLKRVLKGLGVLKVGELKPKQFAEFLADAADIETD